jgi:hypothetical protein
MHCQLGQMKELYLCLSKFTYLDPTFLTWYAASSRFMVVPARTSGSGTFKSYMVQWFRGMISAHCRSISAS